MTEYTPEKVAELVADATSAWETAGRIPQGTMVHETQWLPFANLYNVAESLIDALTAVSGELQAVREWSDYIEAELRQEREKRRPIALSELMQAQADLAQAREVISRVGEYLVAIQNSPGLGDTGHHGRWLHEARAVLATYDRENGTDDVR